MTIKFKENFSFSSWSEIRGACQRFEVKRLALCNNDLKFFGNVWSNQEVASLQLAHGPVLAAEVEEILGYLLTKTNRNSSLDWIKMWFSRKVQTPP